MGWVKIGLPHSEFWLVSLREYQLITGAHHDRMVGEIERKRVLQQELANLIMYAYHKPDKMPDFTKQSKAQAPMGEREATERLRAVFIGMHVASKGS